MPRVNRSRTLEVVGTVRFGFYEVDARFGFVSLETAEALITPDGPNMLQLRLEDVDDARRVRDALQSELGFTYQVQDWIELNGNLYSALWLEKVAISLAIGLIVMVAALNIVASLVLLVMEKTRDIAILRTMGARAGTIRRIFVYQGMAIGLIGPLRTSMIDNGSPVWSILFAALLLGEMLSPLQLSGAALVVAAIVGNQVLHHRQARAVLAER